MNSSSFPADIAILMLMFRVCLLRRIEEKTKTLLINFDHLHLRFTENRNLSGFRVASGVTWYHHHHHHYQGNYSEVNDCQSQTPKQIETSVPLSNSSKKTKKSDRAARKYSPVFLAHAPNLGQPSPVSRRSAKMCLCLHKSLAYSGRMFYTLSIHANLRAESEFGPSSVVQAANLDISILNAWNGNRRLGRRKEKKKEEKKGREREREREREKREREEERERKK